MPNKGYKYKYKYNYKNKKKILNDTGRPTKYNNDIIPKALEYLASCVDTERGLLKPVVKLPKMEGLALYLDINIDTLYEWAKNYPKFSEILDKIRHEQADRLIDKGLSGLYNPTIAKLILGKHGYKDVQEHSFDSGYFEAETEKYNK